MNPSNTSSAASDVREFCGTLANPPWFYKQWMLAGNPAKFFDQLVHDYGDFIHYRGLFDFYLVNHPALVKQVVRETNRSFDKQSVIYRRFQHIFRSGLVVSEGDAWRVRRKLLQPAFGVSAIQKYFRGMVHSTQAMLERWKQYETSLTVFDVVPEMNCLTLEIAGRSLFSDSFADQAADIERWTHEINMYSAKPPLPIVRSPWFPSRRNIRLKQVLSEFHSFVQGLIERRRDLDTAETSDLLDMLLKSKDDETGKLLDDSAVRDEALGMIIGGHETSSSALSWAFYEIARHPHVEEKLVSEIRSLTRGIESLDVRDLSKLRYAKMVIDETLRLHPPFWFENRNVLQDTELGGISLSKGSLVVFSRYSLHRNSAFWSSPDQFNPSRFDPDSPENERASCASIPFGSGPRICIGIHFATMELLVAVTLIVSRYRIFVDSSHRHDMSAALTMLPKYGLKVRIGSR